MQDDVEGPGDGRRRGRSPRAAVARDRRQADGELAWQVVGQVAVRRPEQPDQESEFADRGDDVPGAVERRPLEVAAKDGKIASTRLRGWVQYFLLDQIPQGSPKSEEKR